VLRVPNARTGSVASVRPASAGLLRVCAHVDVGEAVAALAALRVLLVADLLARSAELHGLQTLTVVVMADGAGPAAGSARAAQTQAEALGIRPAAAYGVPRDVRTALGGAVDVHVTGPGTKIDPGSAAVQLAVGPVDADGADPAAAADLFSACSDDPLAVRLALMSAAHREAVGLTAGALHAGRDTLRAWRRLAAVWAESPSRPVPARTARQIGSALASLDTVSALALLADLADDRTVPAGARFEAFAYADRVLGLELARLVGTSCGLARAAACLDEKGARAELVLEMPDERAGPSCPRL